MNNYHLYEEIGHGKFAVVYKGRKRYTIHYVAIKSVEKNRREKVLAEIRVLSQLSHPNIVEFVNWYETRNHLWIIFEYCAGGELLKLIKQDGKLPEDQVRAFGRDICAGLLCVHSRAFIYSDLKTCNLLFTECGTLKLCDFGHAQHLEEVQQKLEDKVPLPRRGTPHYMAPELFYEGGMHSFASDLWSCGCVLFELVVGRPPFNSTSLSEIQQMVLWDPMPLVTNISSDLRALLAGLLCKAPLDRMLWPAARSHGFWQADPPGDIRDLEMLPAQPHTELLGVLWQRWRGGGSGRGDGSQVGVSGEDPQDSFESLSPKRSDPSSPRRKEERPAVAVAMGAATLPHAYGEQSSERPAAAPGEWPSALGANASAIVNLLGPATCELLQELWTFSEIGVMPISQNPSIEEPEVLDRGQRLPFEPLCYDGSRTQPHSDLEAFFAKVYKCIAQGPQNDKIAALLYLESICPRRIQGPRSCEMQIADLVVNSSLLRLVLRMLLVPAGPSAGSISLPLRVRLLSLVGQLLRHTTYLDPAVAELGLFDALLAALRGPDVVPQRRASAALGELLFYIAAPPAEAIPSELEGRWVAPSNARQVFCEIAVDPDFDEVARHYVVKTIENIATQCPAVAQQWFFSVSMLQGLASSVLRSTCDAFRLSCLAVLVQLVRGRGAFAAAPLQPLEGWPVAGVVAAGLDALAPQGVPLSLQLAGVILMEAPEAGAALQLFPTNVVELLMGATARLQLSTGLRGRAAAVLGALCALDGGREARCLRQAVDLGFVAHVDRLARDKEPLAARGAAAAAAALAALAPALLQRLVEQCRQLGASAGGPSAEALADALLPLLLSLLHLVSSTTFCPCILSSRTLPLIGGLCDVAARAPQPLSEPPAGQSWPSVHQVQPLVLMFVEAMSTQQDLVLKNAGQVVRCVLPVLAGHLLSGRADVRLLALKSFVDVCAALLNDLQVFDPMAESPTDTTVLLEAVLCNRVLPALQRLLADEPPAPSYVFRLLAALLSRGSRAAGSAVRELALAPVLLDAMREDGALSVHAALLVQCLLQGHEVSVSALEDAGVLSAVHALLADAADVHLVEGPAAQLDFAMLDAALGVAEEAYAQQELVASGRGGRASSSVLLVDLGELAHSHDLLADLCVTLAHAMHAPLLDRAVACFEQLTKLSAPASVAGVVAGLSSHSVAALLEVLALLADCREELGAGAAAGIQRRTLAALGCGLRGDVGGEVRAMLAAGLEQLFEDRVFAGDTALSAAAQSLLVAVLPMAMGGRG